MPRLFFGFFLASALIFSVSPSFAAAVPAGSVITIKSVELKNDKGQWLTIIEPDKQVDITKEESGLSFFNNNRVPPGNYVNFRIVVFERSPKETMEVHGIKDFMPSLEVKRGSFIGVWFQFDLRLLPAKEIRQVTVTLDEKTVVYSGDEIAKK